MRTVLAVDEMLAAAVRRKIPSAETLDHAAMRDLGDAALPRLRELALRAPGVLVTGGRAWDALPMLRRLRLPRTLPVVLLTPSATWARQAEAARLGVVAIVPCDDGTDTRTAIEREIQIAWSLLRHPSPRPQVVLVQRERRPPVAVLEGRLLRPQVAAWSAKMTRR